MAIGWLIVFTIVLPGFCRKRHMSFKEGAAYRVDNAVDAECS